MPRRSKGGGNTGEPPLDGLPCKRWRRNLLDASLVPVHDADWTGWKCELKLQSLVLSARISTLEPSKLKYLPARTLFLTAIPWTTCVVPLQSWTKQNSQLLVSNHSLSPLHLCQYISLRVPVRSNSYTENNNSLEEDTIRERIRS